MDFYFLRCATSLYNLPKIVNENGLYKTLKAKFSFRKFCLHAIIKS